MHIWSLHLLGPPHVAGVLPSIFRHRLEICCLWKGVLVGCVLSLSFPGPCNLMWGEPLGAGWIGKLVAVARYMELGLMFLSVQCYGSVDMPIFCLF